MNIFHAIFLAVIQGLTEFLPVSSSGHLVLFQKLFNFSEPPVFFDILLHLGTLTAILVFFRKDIIFFIKKWKDNVNIWLYLLVGSIPAAVFGFWLNSRIETVFNSLALVGGAWILFGLLLFSTRFWVKKEKLTINTLENLGSRRALTIGFFQALALIPGISRSGLTIIGGLSNKLSYGESFKFSFLLAIPAILGATIVSFEKNSFNGVGFTGEFLAFIIAGISGYFSLIIFQKILKAEKLYLFGIYCLTLGILVLVGR